MSGYELLERFNNLSKSEKEYAFSYFAGAVGMVAEGFSIPHDDQAHAKWALEEFATAIEKAKRK